MTRVHKSGLPLATHIRPLSEGAFTSRFFGTGGELAQTG